MQESVASMAYQLEVPKANLLFRGKFKLHSILKSLCRSFEYKPRDAILTLYNSLLRPFLECKDNEKLE